MRYRLFALMVIAPLLIQLVSPVPVGAGTKTFIAVINGGQEVPPTTSNAIGVALLTFDSTTDDLCYSISFTTLVGTETAAHFHGPAAPGTNAPIIFFITPPGPSPLGSPKTGCVGPLSGPQQSDLKKGKIYLNVHSTVFPGGEIRGQIVQTR